MPFSSRPEAIRGRFAPWNTPTTAMRSGVQKSPIPTRHLRSGGETQIPMWSCLASSGCEPLLARIVPFLTSLALCFLLQGAAALDVLEIGVARNFPLARTGSDHQRVLLWTRETLALPAGIRQAVLAHQPVCSGRINPRSIDLVAMLLAELLKGSVGNERINHPQLASGNPTLHLGHGHSQKVRCPLPRESFHPSNQSGRNFHDSGGLKKRTILVAECRQRAYRDARIAHSQHAVSDEATEMMGATYA